MTSTPAELTLRVQNLEQTVKGWDTTHGELISIASEARDSSRAAQAASEAAHKAAERSANVGVRVSTEVASLKVALNGKQREVDDRLTVLELGSDDDDFDMTTDVMEREDLIKSRRNLRGQVSEMKLQLQRLEQAESEREEAEVARHKAEQEKAIVERAKEEAKKEFEKAAKERDEAARERDEAAKQRDSKGAELKKERIRSRTSIALAIITAIGGIGATIAAAYWG